MNDLISVIIPIYNAEKYLENSIKSVINQSYKNLEILLIDDGSTDLSRKICEGLVREYSNVFYYDKPNLGVSSARNLGIAKASGKFIYFMDADDELEFNMLEEMVNNMISTNFVICNHNVIYNNKTIEKNTELISKFIGKNELYKMLNAKEFFCGYVWNKLYNLELIKEYNIFFNEDIHILEDLLFNIEYLNLKEIKNAFYIEKPLYNYYIRESSSLNSFSMLDKKKINRKLTEFYAIEKILELYNRYALNTSFLIKKRYIQTTYKYYFLFKKNNVDVNILKYNINQSKIYFKEIFNKLSLKERIKLSANILCPSLYGNLGQRMRKE